VKKIKGYIKKIDLVTLGLQIIVIAFLFAIANEIFFGLDEEEPIEVIHSETEATFVEETPYIEETPEATVEVVQVIREEETEEVLMDDLELLAQLVQAEAGNQDMIGKRLVVDVVLNRVDSESFPNTIREVIFQPYQFSSVTDGGLERAGYRMTEEDYEAVRLELVKRLDEEITFFTAGAYNGYCEPCYQHGAHYFGKEKE